MWSGPFAQNSEDELDQYFGTPCTHRSTNVLQFWAVSSKNFTKLSSLALKILFSQATSVASERAFSTSGDLDAAKRNRMSDSSFEGNILIKSWMKSVQTD